MKSNSIRELSTKIDSKEYITDIFNQVKGIENRLNEDEKRLVDNLVSKENFIEFYESLIYSGNLGEYYSPECLSELIFELTGDVQGKDVYEPTIGSGMLVSKYYQSNNIFGQEFNRNTFEITSKIFEKAHIERGDTLKDDKFKGRQFDLIVSNPPYSTSWEQIDDERFNGLLAPKSKSDLAFVQHCVHHMKKNAECYMIMFPGILYRGGVEAKIRKRLIENKNIKSIIQLPENLFSNTSVATVLIILKKDDVQEGALFVDASSFFKKHKKNVIEKEHIDRIKDIVLNKKEVDFISKLVSEKEIEENDFNLSVNQYIEKEDTREKVDILELEKEISLIKNRRRKIEDKLDDFIKQTFYKETEKEDNQIKLF